ncbi:hypothetical protein TIFTF001_052923 [Ficus carica]|uniref:Uncharacterized protein n=1 Tax=Ficus carica TaxID=3494 RepID=A0AA88JFS4_FICCA|nr:hypothetical protein TIFTF001_052923 [Ficus carica]
MVRLVHNRGKGGNGNLGLSLVTEIQARDVVDAGELVIGRPREAARRWAAVGVGEDEDREGRRSAWGHLGFVDAGGLTGFATVHRSVADDLQRSRTDPPRFSSPLSCRTTARRRCMVVGNQGGRLGLIADSLI